MSALLPNTFSSSPSEDEELDIDVDPALLQEDFYCDEEFSEDEIDRNDDSSEEDAEEGDDYVPCDYTEDLQNKSDLKVMHERQARLAFEQSGIMGLFHLFMTKSWFLAMRQWYNQNLT